MDKKRGFALIAAMAFVAITSAVVYFLLERSQFGLQGVRSRLDLVEEEYKIEDSIYKSIEWLNSGKIYKPFSGRYFSKLFDVTSPSFGSNDGLYPVPTQLKLKGTDKSVIYSTDPDLGSSTFGSLLGMLGAAFPVAPLRIDGAKVKITLVNGVPLSGGVDEEASDAKDHYPIFRIDAMSGIQSGMHRVGYVVGKLIYGGRTGIYGEQKAVMGGRCDAYDSSESLYSTDTKSPDCLVASYKKVEIGAKGVVWGSVAANKEVKIKKGGEVCKDFQDGCPNEGEVCEGGQCNVSKLKGNNGWESYCPTDQGDLTVNGSMILKLSGGSPDKNCWSKVTIRNKSTLTLVSTRYDYFFKKLEFKGKKSLLKISPSTKNGVVSLHVKEIEPKTIKGKAIENSFRPVQFEFLFHGDDKVNLSGTELYMALIAPSAEIKVMNNVEFWGVIKAKKLSVGRKAFIHYDLSEGSSGELTGIFYKLTRVENLLGRSEAYGD
ncbi:MAG: hypothetical protein D6808_04180 [Candidatus Dadabacteria bacterium]|nr:MAG: hypothetical protein D6808_04180 [Candidatus Dadabacteria bacterium]